MNLVLLCHPLVLGSASMPRYARMIGDGMTRRGHRVEYWTAPSLFVRLAPKPGTFRKWLGYIDAYLIFPAILKFRKRSLSKDTLLVVTDHALGMWVPPIAAEPHVIHCHDFIAQRSAFGDIPGQAAGLSGRTYQKLIRRGYCRGRNFISISENTRNDLNHFLKRPPNVSEVVYNGLHYPFAAMPAAAAADRLKSKHGPAWRDGYFLHVGGNQWYKNRSGVIKLYHQYLIGRETGLPLVMIGAPPNRELRELAEATPRNGRVCFFSEFTDPEVHAAYVLATALIFPSWEEGFGWPIIEAQASGCPVITTQAAPMTEVGGDAAWYLPAYSRQNTDETWLKTGAALMARISRLSGDERNKLVTAGIRNAKRFTAESALNRFEEIYQTILRANGRQSA